jgi:hypothetical protein
MARHGYVVVFSVLAIFLFMTAGAASALSFTDVTAEAGAGDKGRGKGVAFADIDGDGDWDMYLSNKGGANVLYRNDSTPGNIRFTDITASAGDNLGDTGYCMGSVFGDIDNDGDPDLFIAKGGQHEIEPNRLLRNDSTDGEIRFTDVSVEAGIGTRDFTYQGAFGDYDRDGDLDLFMANYGVGVKSRLFRNDSTGGAVRFTEVTDEAGVGLPGWAWGASFSDVNGDGWADIYVVSGRYPAGESNKLFRNNGDGTFSEIAREAGVADPNWGLGASWQDIDRDGDPDLYLSNYVGENKLFRNDGDFTFTDISAEAGVANDGWGKGPSFADIDHDGDLDFYEGDCKLANQLYVNDGSGIFSDRVADFPSMKNEGVRTKATAFSDFDGDGDLDLYVVNWNVPNRVYMNGQNDHNYLKVRLVGSASNTMAVGSVVRVFEGGHSGDMTRFVSQREMQTATGFCSQEAQELHFGLDASGTYDLVVNFPSGSEVKVDGVKPGQTLTVEESQAVAGK